MKKLYVVFIFACSMLLAESFTYVNKSVINLHLRPDKRAEVATQLIYATSVKIVKEKGSWVKVHLPAYEGWTLKKNLIQRNTIYPTSQYGKVKNLWSYIYEVKDTTPHPPIFTLPFETTVEILTPKNKRTTRWIRVRLLDGTEGWAHTLEYDLDLKPLSMNQTIQLSKKFLGIPYRWAGTSSFGFDCSGFVQMLYRQMGIYIPRNSRMQANFSKAKAVEKKNLKPGDLVFFGKGKITHVGMYLGNQKFIHSDTLFRKSKTLPSIQISNLEDPEWVEEYICSRRYLD